jgi:hypothetical protein
VYRWHGAATGETGQVVRGEEISLETELPHGDGVDHAEGIALIEPDDGAAPRLLVVYDSPSPSRRPTPHSVLADSVVLAAAAGAGV